MIRLPISAPLSLNVQMHHMARAAKVKELRDSVHMLARLAKIPKCQKVRVTLIYQPRDARRRDSVNLVPTMKACEDGLVDAKVVPDDTPFFLESCMPLIDVPVKGQPGALDLLVERML
jgi:crossover junction endodeoxyribonuclease RusA